MTSATEVENDSGESNGQATSSDEPTDLEKQIVRQIEFYFGDANMPRDKFMLEQVKVDDGWIPMSVMLKFQRLSRISSEPEVIVKALKHSQLVEVDTTGSDPKIRRSAEMPLPELNEERRKEVLARSLYMKGFPLDSTIDSVQSVLDPIAPTECIVLRKYKDKISQSYKFKGSVFATYKDSATAQSVLDAPPIKVNETELLRLWQTDYIEKKKKEIETEKLSRSRSKRKQPAEAEGDQNGTRKLKKNATIHAKGFKPETTREMIKEELTKLGVDPVYIGFKMGQEEGYLRFAAENSAPKSFELLQDKLKVNDADISVRILEGEEEEEYLKKAGEDMKAHLDRCEQARKAGGRRGGGKRRFHGKRGGHRDGPAAKRQAV